VVSIVDLTALVEKPTDVQTVNAVFRAASESKDLAGILGYSEEPLVSSDYQGDPRSSILDALTTMVSGGHLVKVLAWYDNEWAFSTRLIDLALHMESVGL
jgi:glyceraldehyde 3-phosphate dehydrogenase